MNLIIPNNITKYSFDENNTDNNFTNNRSIKFSWDKVNGANNYNIIISGDENFTNIIKDEIINVTEYILPEGLDGGLFGKKYFWKVRALNTYELFKDFSVIEPKISDENVKNQIKFYYENNNLKNNLSNEEKKTLYYLYINNGLINISIPTSINKLDYEEKIINKVNDTIKTLFNQYYRLNNNFYNLDSLISYENKYKLYEILKEIGYF